MDGRRPGDCRRGSDDPPPGRGRDAGPRFQSRHRGECPSTRWTLVVHARDPDSPEVTEALAWICHAYWYPLYAYIRHKGRSANEAQDLNQEFFARLLEKGFLRTADRDKGKVRAFLLAGCKHFLANERDRRRAATRGGGRIPNSIDLGDAERQYRLEPVDRLTPEALFERRWALSLLDHILDQFGRE